MAAKHILAVLALAFLTAAPRLLRGGGMAHPQTKTWLIVSAIAIFTAVSARLFSQE